MEKHSVSRLSYLFGHLHLLSSYSFSSTLLSSNLSLLSASSLLCFSSVHIVGSYTPKLPSINIQQNPTKSLTKETVKSKGWILQHSPALSHRRRRLIYDYNSYPLADVVARSEPQNFSSVYLSCDIHIFASKKSLRFEISSCTSKIKMPKAPMPLTV